MKLSLKIGSQPFKSKVALIDSVSRFGSTARSEIQQKPLKKQGKKIMLFLEDVALVRVTRANQN